MVKKIKILVLLLLMMFSLPGRAEQNGFFTLDHTKFKVSDASVIEIKNMPVVRSQDSIGLCFAFEAAGAIDAANCKARNWDCSQLDDNRRVSSLDLAHYSGSYQQSKDHISPDEKDLSQTEGGNATLAVNEALFGTGSFIRESCAPFDQLVAKQGTAEQVVALQTASWENLKNLYIQIHKKVGNCETCALNYQATGEETTKLKDIEDDFKLQRDNADLLRAFAAGTYSEFLNKILVPEKCKQSARNHLLLTGQWSLEYFPKEKKDENYNAFLSKVKGVLKMGNPIMVNNFCAQDKAPNSAKDCADYQHGFLISGYRKVCDSKNQCRDAVKVHNSWGQNWQDHNDDGWVDAKELFNRTYYQHATLGWLEQPTH